MVTGTSLLNIAFSVVVITVIIVLIPFIALAVMLPLPQHTDFFL